MAAAAAPRRRLTDYVRREVAASQGWRCNVCKKLLSAAFQVDHMRPIWSFRAEEDPNDKANLQALCASCHADKTASENSKRALAPPQTTQSARTYSKYFVKGTREYAAVNR